MVSERLTNNDFKTLNELPKKTFHQLSYPEQLAIMQRSVLQKEGTQDYFDTLTAEKVNKEEARIVHLLLRPDLCGPFASTLLENSYAWRNYIDDNSNDVKDAFCKAINDNLWAKYIGMYDYDSNWMGEIVHAATVTTSAYSPHRKGVMPLSPANYAPSYKYSIDNPSRKQNALFVGAFSVKSVVDIWAIGKHIIPQSNLSIIDINGNLSTDAAKHYDIPYIKSDGLKSCFIGQSNDLIMTNNLVQSLDQGNWNYDPERINGLREDLYVEISRITKSGGKIVMVEQPLMRDLSKINWSEESDHDRKIIYSQLKRTGFKDISILPAVSFKDRKTADRFVTNGVIRSQDVVEEANEKTALLIIATKL